MQVHQLVHTLNYGDAISGEALALQRLLQRKGIESFIYSVHAHEKVKSFCRPWTQAASDRNSAGTEETVVWIHHYSIGSPLNRLFEQQANIQRVLIYHNLTPEHWFQQYNTRVYDDLRLGRAELPRLLSCADIVLGDSTYNVEELRDFGCSKAQVLPLPFDSERWSESANAGIRYALNAHGGTNVLVVGRVAPNKCIQDAIKAFYFYHFKIQEKSRLWVVGSNIDTEIYSLELRTLVSELRLREAVNFVGSVSDGELRAFYEESDVYLTMSEHEGFCVPLLEAMNFGVPAIAYASGAVPETLGDAGILLNDKSPEKVAELMHLVISDAELNRELVRRGQERVSEFQFSRFEQDVEARILSPLQSLKSQSSSRHVG